MTGFYKFGSVFFGKQIGPYVCGLICFAAILLTVCTGKKSERVEVQWENGQAVALLIPAEWTPVPTSISVQRKGVESPILGNVVAGEEWVRFVPLIPFTAGLEYTILRNDQAIASVKIPLPDELEAPVVKAVFPSGDTVPENLLKIYVQFSRPMRESKASDFIFLMKGNADTVKGAFLDLDPALWNHDRTLLTLWLDPGRVKRDLQPNIRMGAPMIKDQHYTIVVSAGWKDLRGAASTTAFEKHYFTIARDSLSPAPKAWKIKYPAAGTTAPLKIDFNEELDYSLLSDVFHVRDKSGNVVVGKTIVVNQEKGVHWMPLAPWKAGEYFLLVENRLEDLAANNLNRLFERDLSKGEASSVEKGEMISIPFKL